MFSVKRLIILIPFVLILLLLSACANDGIEDGNMRETNDLENRSKQYSAVLIRYEDEEFPVELNDSLIPALDALSVCGIQIHWDDGTHAHFQLEEKTYEISISDCYIGEKGSGHNLILNAPGSNSYSVRSDGTEIYIDSDTLDGLFFFLHLSARTGSIISVDQSGDG